MRLAVMLEQRYARTPEGRLWTTAPADYQFWCRYLEVFDHVCVVARVQDVPVAQPGWKRVDGQGVTYSALPYYVGPFQYALRSRQMHQVIRSAIASNEAVIIRVSGVAGSVAYKYLRANKRPFGVEVVSDPYEVLAPGVVKHPLRPLFRWWFTRQLQAQCIDAVAVAYVTKMILPYRYPAARDALATPYSSVELKDEAFVFSDINLDSAAFVPTPRTGARHIEGAYKLVFVGSLAQMYKGPDILIDAVAKCLSKGLETSLTVVGSGKYRAELEARAKALGIAKRVRFLGELPASAPVRAQLDEADLFVLPSRTDALPRAIIEAMARGLPCIGSTVGGIPELLPPEDMVPPSNVAALARKILEVANNPTRQAAMSARNLEKAKEYHKKLLGEVRKSFYEYTKKETEKRLKRNN